MEVRKFMNNNKNVSFLDLKQKLYKEHNIKINEDIKNNYYMLTSTNKSDYNNIFIRQCTGLILEKDTNNILHYFGEKSYDINNEYNNNIINLEHININNSYISDYINGYIVKVFNYNKQWNFATSNHTDIKHFKIKESNTILYDLFKKRILKTFDTMNDFLRSLDDSYCYTFIIEEDKLNIINKFNLKDLKEEFNFNNYISLNKYILNSKYSKNKKFILIEKDKIYISKKIHINNNDMKQIIYRYNNILINDTPKLKNIQDSYIKNNYEDYIIEKEICKYDNNCIYYLKNKCNYKHINNTLNFDFLLNI